MAWRSYLGSFLRVFGWVDGGPEPEGHQYTCRAFAIDQPCHGVIRFAQPRIVARVNQGGRVSVDQTSGVPAIMQPCGRVEIDQ